MKKLFKKIALSLSLLISMSSVSAFASEENTEVISRADNKVNFNFISTEYYNTEYTYEEYGKQYKVLETSNEALDNIHTEIFVKDDNNEYILIEKYDTVITRTEDNTIEVTKIKDGELTTEIISIEEEIPAKARVGWELVDVHNGSTRFQNFTYTIVTGILVSIVSGGIGIVANNVVGAVASIIVSERVPSVYYRRYVRYYRDYYGTVTMVSANNNFYYDSSHKYSIGSASQTWSGKFPW